MRLNSIKTLMRPITKKAQRLLELKESGFTVPPFFVVSRKTRNLDQLSTLQSNSIILRGCISTEDGEIKSQAGQSLSLGPIDKRQISRCLEIIFDSTDSIEIIVQEFVDAPTGVLFCYSSDLSFLEDVFWGAVGTFSVGNKLELFFITFFTSFLDGEKMRVAAS